MPTLEDLARAIEGSNPFRRNRVSDPSSVDADETTIHAQEFERLCARIDAVRRDNGSAGILVVGQAGVGKSHLLARLFGWSRENQITSVFLHNVLASPDRIARYLLHAMVSALAGNATSYAESKLYGLLNHAIHKALAAEKTSGKKRASPSMPDRLKALTALGKKHDPKDRVMPVVKAFLENAAPRDEESQTTIAEAAVEWLSGETIETEDAIALGLGSNPSRASLADDEAVRDVLQLLAALASSAGKPFVLCIDQVDNLDHDKIKALTNFLHALLDHCKNLVVVLSGVRENMYELREKRVIPEAAWDRVAEYRIELAKLHRDEARLLVRRRVEATMKPFSEIREVAERIAKDDLFPVGRAWFDHRLEGLVEVRARDVVSWARDAWDEEHARLAKVGMKPWLSKWGRVEGGHGAHPPGGKDDPAAIDRLTATKVKEHVSQRALAPDGLPANIDNWRVLVESVLARCVGDTRYKLQSVARPSKGAYHLVTARREDDGGEVQSALVFVAAPNANAATNALKKMVDDTAAPGCHYLVSDEGRRPLKLGAVGRKAYDGLVGLGDTRFQHVKLTFQDHAELDAFEGVVGAARTGDLEIDTGAGARRVSETEVTESLHRQGFFAKHPLLRRLLVGDIVAEAVPSPAPQIDRQRARETIASYLSWRIGTTARELTRAFIALEAKKPGTKRMRAEEVLPQIVSIADEMHKEGLVYVTAQEDDRFIQVAPKGVGRSKA
jgi:type II secretory pathway predicted ATPase ExeA